jgi:hypothetical protein
MPFDAKSSKSLFMSPAVSAGHVISTTTHLERKGKSLIKEISANLYTQSSRQQACVGSAPKKNRHAKARVPMAYISFLFSIDAS